MTTVDAVRRRLLASSAIIAKFAIPGRPRLRPGTTLWNYRADWVERVRRYHFSIWVKPHGGEWSRHYWSSDMTGGGL